MYSGQLVFAQLMEHIPLHTFRRCVQRYPSKYPTKTFSHLDQFLCMAFAQLTYRESLRDILRRQIEKTVGSVKELMAKPQEDLSGRY